MTLGPAFQEEGQRIACLRTPRHKGVCTKFGGGGCHRVCVGVPPAHMLMPMTLVTLRTLTGASSMVPSGPHHTWAVCFLDWDPPALRAPQAFGSSPNPACRAQPWLCSLGHCTPPQPPPEQQSHQNSSVLSPSVGLHS